MSDMSEMETMYTTGHQVAPYSGFPMLPDREYVVPRKMAMVRYEKGLARPAAEVHLERLMKLGLVGITVAADAEPSVLKAAQVLGLKISGVPGRRKKEAA